MTPNEKATEVGSIFTHQRTGHYLAGLSDSGRAAVAAVEKAVREPVDIEVPDPAFVKGEDCWIYPRCEPPILRAQPAVVWGFTADGLIDLGPDWLPWGRLRTPDEVWRTKEEAEAACETKPPPPPGPPPPGPCPACGGAYSRNDWVRRRKDTPVWACESYRVPGESFYQSDKCKLRQLRTACDANGRMNGGRPVVIGGEVFLLLTEQVKQGRIFSTRQLSDGRLTVGVRTMGGSCWRRPDELWHTRPEVEAALAKGGG